MEELYKDPRTLEHMREGPLGASVDAFAQQLIYQGYARASVRYALQLVTDFGRWLTRRRIPVAQVTAKRLADYLSDRSRCRHFRSGDASILRRLLSLLTEQGAVAQAPPIKPIPAEQLAAEFRLYLERERRLAPATVFLYLGFVQRFLVHYAPDDQGRLERLQAADVGGG